ncbi:MAG TPA: DNA translocase FtsK, partial [Thermohalobaculum sp.]|nr:DNA translocase FtsK [Thermohalobaculum sp.]
GFGVASWGLVVFLMVWAGRFITHLGERRLPRRAPMLAPAIVLGMIFASTHGPWEGWQLSSGLGGFIGDTVVVSMVGVLPMSPTATVQAISLVTGLATLGFAGSAFGITALESRVLFFWILRSFLLALAQLIGFGHIALRAGYNRVRDMLRKPRSERLEPAEPTGSWKTRAGKLGAKLAPSGSGDEPAAAKSGESWRDRMARLRNRGTEPPMTRVSGAEEEWDDEDDGAGVDMARAIRARTGLPDDGEDDEASGARPRPRHLRAVASEQDERPASPVSQPPAKPQKMSRRAAREQEPMLFESMNDAEAYDAPPLSMLEKPVSVVRAQMSDTALQENARMLETVLEDYGVRGEITAVKPGPVVTLYELEPAPGLKASRIIGLADDIARSMSALAARVSTVPGRSVIGIELPNAEREKVLLRALIESPAYGDSQIKLALALGKDISGQPIVANLAKMPHLLIAGTTGSGKSVAINTMILSLLYRLSPKQCRLIMIDPKMLELSVYDNIPHLLAPVVTDPKKAVVALKWVVAEMEDRYRKMSKLGVRNIDGYNGRVREALKKGEDFNRVVQTGFDDTTGEPVYESESMTPEEMPFIVVIVDEMADLMMVAGKEIEACIQRLAQMARASGIHLIMATQRPSVDVITGTIKANFPTRISFQVTSKIDSRTILGEQGAEQLLGQGDMLYMAGGGRITRVHGPFVSDEEVEEVVNHLKSLGAPDYEEAVTDGGDDDMQATVEEKLGLASPGDDEATLYDKAVAIVARDRKCSTSYIQRKLAIGYNKAARLVEQMESEGVVSPANAVGKRDIMVEER